jgi:hypothetical protein
MGQHFLYHAEVDARKRLELKLALSLTRELETYTRSIKPRYQNRLKSTTRHMVRSTERFQDSTSRDVMITLSAWVRIEQLIREKYSSDVCYSLSKV